MSRNIAKSRQGGFSLVELLIALLVASIVMAAATSLFRQALVATYSLTQRADMLQNARGSINTIVRDLTRAGGGVPTGGIALPAGTALAPRFACDGAACYVALNTYPNNQMYALTQGYRKGIIDDAGINTDVVTMLYVDTSITMQISPIVGNNTISNNGDTVTIVPPTTPGSLTTPAIDDAALGITPGDILLFTNANGSAIGNVTAVNGATGVITMATNDSLNLNQPLAISGNIRAIGVSGTNPRTYPATSVVRLQVVTYFLQLQPDGSKRLMKQVSGHPPVPVADNVLELSFWYDVYDDNTAQETSHLGNAVTPLGVQEYNSIRKINVSVTVRSNRPDPRTKRFDTLTLTTQLSPRGLSFKDRYQ